MAAGALVIKRLRAGTTRGLPPIEPFGETTIEQQRHPACDRGTQPGDAARVATALGLLPTGTSRSVTAALLNASAGTDDSAGTFADARERLIAELLTSLPHADQRGDVGRLTSPRRPNAL